MSGTVTATATTITWQSDLSPTLTSEMLSTTAIAGAFSRKDGQNFVNNLDIQGELAAIPESSPALMLAFGLGLLLLSLGLTKFRLRRTRPGRCISSIRTPEVDQ